MTAALKPLPFNYLERGTTEFFKPNSTRISFKSQNTNPHNKTPRHASFSEDHTTLLAPFEARREQQRQFLYRFEEEVPVLASNTWDSRHLDQFLSIHQDSNTSELYQSQANRAGPLSLSGRSHLYKPVEFSPDHSFYFRTTVDNKNTSHIGFRRNNPLVSNVAINQMSASKVRDRLAQTQTQQWSHSNTGSKIQQLPFRFEANKVKFMPTDPLKHRSTPQPQDSKEGFKRVRLAQLINKRYPHGMLGVDHPENNVSDSLYEKEKIDTRIREEPNSHNTFLIDREWKTKKHLVAPQQLIQTKREMMTLRRSANETRVSFNIVNNHESPNE